MTSPRLLSNNTNSINSTAGHVDFSLFHTWAQLRLKSLRCLQEIKTCRHLLTGSIKCLKQQTLRFSCSISPFVWPHKIVPKIGASPGVDGRCELQIQLLLVDTCYRPTPWNVPRVSFWPKSIVRLSEAGHQNKLKYSKYLKLLIACKFSTQAILNICEVNCNDIVQK